MAESGTADSSAAVRQAKGGSWESFWFIFNILSVIFSTLSLIALARHIYAVGFSAPLTAMMDAYAVVTRLLIGWADPYILSAVAWIGSFYDWRPTLNPRWREMFVLFAFVAAGVGRSLRLRHTDFFRSLATAVFLLSIALALALTWGLLPFFQEDAKYLIYLGVGLVVGATALIVSNLTRENTTYALTILGGFAGVVLFFAIDLGLKILLG